MSKKDPKLAAGLWDEEYRSGKYKDDTAIPFVNTILETLDTEKASEGNGLYVGCGNGRNYIPLIDAGLHVTGLDISPEALAQVEENRPAVAGKLVCADFLEYQPDEDLDYLISIQVFQHGNQAEVAKHFAKTASIMKPGGLLFLRVNSTSTDIFHDHIIDETTSDGGATITYSDGPKKGLSIHFFSKAELVRLTGKEFEAIQPLEEVTMERKPPKIGSWVQWEGIWRRR